MDNISKQNFLAVQEGMRQLNKQQNDIQTRFDAMNAALTQQQTIITQLQQDIALLKAILLVNSGPTVKE